MNNLLDQQHEGYTKEITRDFFKNVYAYMFLALAISGGIAYYVGSSAEMFNQYFRSETGGWTPLFYVILFAPIGVSLLIQSAYRRLSMTALMSLFILYSGLIGLMLSSVFMFYSMQSIAVTFFVTAGAFGGMAILGFTTKTDLTKMGSLLYYVFIGLFFAFIANWYFKSLQFDYILSFIGVFVFTGLTAFWMQKLKNVSQDSMLQGVERQKLALVGGLTLYILFINLFLMLLRFTGGSRD